MVLAVHAFAFRSLVAATPSSLVPKGADALHDGT
jgi:hypothetical protein